jgi:hypothetical protein
MRKGDEARDRKYAQVHLIPLYPFSHFDKKWVELEK